MTISHNLTAFTFWQLLLSFFIILTLYLRIVTMCHMIFILNFKMTYFPAASLHINLDMFFFLQERVFFLNKWVLLFLFFVSLPLSLFSPWFGYFVLVKMLFRKCLEKEWCIWKYLRLYVKWCDFTKQTKIKNLQKHF